MRLPCLLLGEGVRLQDVAEVQRIWLQDLGIGLRLQAATLVPLRRCLPKPLPQKPGEEPWEESRRVGGGGGG
jgi:hypothetical protein